MFYVSDRCTHKRAETLRHVSRLEPATRRLSQTLMTPARHKDDPKEGGFVASRSLLTGNGWSWHVCIVKLIVTYLKARF